MRFRVLSQEFYRLLMETPITQLRISTYEFADLIRDTTLDAEHTLVSFDVVSLPTEIPVDLAIKVAERTLTEDASLGQRTSLLVEDLVDLSTFYLNTTQFVYSGTYYQQSAGVAQW